MLLLLDEISRRYHTDPLTVVETWSPLRLSLARECIDEDLATQAQLIQRIRPAQSPLPVPYPVVVIGRA